MLKKDTIYRADGTEEAWTKPNTLKGWQEVVGGYVENLMFEDKAVLINEDGLMKQLPFNKTVSAAIGIQVVGDILVLSRDSFLES